MSNILVKQKNSMDSFCSMAMVLRFGRMVHNIQESGRRAYSMDMAKSRIHLKDTNIKVIGYEELNAEKAKSFGKMDHIMKVIGLMIINKVMEHL